MEHESTVQLLHRCSLGRDDAAWEDFARRVGPRLEASIRSVLTRAGFPTARERVEELRQEIYCRLLDRDRRLLRRFRGSSEGEAAVWLGRVVRSAVVDQLRAEGAAKRGESRQVPLEGAWAGGGDPPAPQPGPEEHLLARERRRQVLARCRRAAGSRVSRRALRVLELAFLHGWSSREIARSAIGRGLAASSIDSIVCRVRRRLAGEGVVLPRR